ncbi:MAG: hypothetical protein Q9169_008139 [Polycauliona sp. 2 TL-2023]
MSSTTDSSDWEHNIVPQSRRPSTTSQSSKPPRKKSRPTPQPILPRKNVPGQSVFSVSEPIQYMPPVPLNPMPFHHPYYQGPHPIPPMPPIGQNTNPTPPAWNSPPQSTALPKDTLPQICTTPQKDPPPQLPISPQMTAPPQGPTVAQMDTPPNYATPPSRPIRGVKSGARGARGSRGGRPSRVKVEPSDNGETSLAANTPVEGRGSARGRARGARTNRGSRPRGSRAGVAASRGVKRKRDEEDEKDDSDVSEIITPLPTQSRSGRKITHANTYSPVIIDLEEKRKPSISAKSIKAAIPIAESPEPTSNKGRKRASKPGEASVCKNCGRGHSPASNMIVFCDGCNAPWHQFCHDPPISQDVISVPEREWFCADCQVLREEKAHVEGKVSAPTLSIVEKRRYLQTLSSQNLVSLLLHASILHPDLPIFATSSGGPVPERPKRPVTHFVDPTAPPAEEEEDEMYPESDYLPYPKAGNGVPLPSESESLALLIDEDVGVYSHRKQDAEEEEELQALPSEGSEEEEEEYEESDASDVDDEDVSDDEVEEVAAAPPAAKKRKTTSTKKDAPEEVDDDEDPEAVDDDDEDAAAAPGEDDDDDDDDAEEEEAEDTAAKGGPAAAAKKVKGAQVPKEDDLEEVKGLGDDE